MSPAPSPVPAAPRRRRRLLPIAALVVAVLTALSVSACTSSGSAPQTNASPPTGAAQSAAGGGAFTARTLDGETITVPGGQPTALFFFSVTCGTCGPGAAAMAQAQQAVADRAHFAAVDVAPNETIADIRGFLTSNQAGSLAFARDTNSQLISNYQVRQIGTVVVLDAAGNEVFRGYEPSAAQIQDAMTKAGLR